MCYVLKSDLTKSKIQRLVGSVRYQAGGNRALGGRSTLFTVTGCEPLDSDLNYILRGLYKCIKMNVDFSLYLCVVPKDCLSMPQLDRALMYKYTLRNPAQPNPAR